MAQAEREGVRRSHRNPYLERIQRDPFLIDDPYRIQPGWADAERSRPISRWSLREAYVEWFAWAIPNEEALAAIAEYAPILEVGAGAGYWAALLRARGVDIVATDKLGPGQRNHYHKSARAWTTIKRLLAVDAVKAFPTRTLLLCWPPYREDAASYHALRAYRGTHVIYIGEGDGGCTGSWRFHEYLDAKFELVREVDIPKYWGIHDRLMIWRRSAQPRRMTSHRCYTCGRFHQYDYGECDRCMAIDPVVDKDTPEWVPMGKRLARMNRADDKHANRRQSSFDKKRRDRVQ